MPSQDKAEIATADSNTPGRDGDDTEAGGVAEALGIDGFGEAGRI